FNGMKATIITILNGDKGGMSFMGNVSDLEEERLADSKEELYAGRVGNLLVLLNEPGFKLAPLGDYKVGDRPAVGIKVSHEGHKGISTCFDKARGLLLKS